MPLAVTLVGDPSAVDQLRTSLSALDGVEVSEPESVETPSSLLDSPLSAKQITESLTAVTAVVTLSSGVVQLVSTLHDEASKSPAPVVVVNVDSGAELVINAATPPQTIAEFLQSSDADPADATLR